ncbi:MmgE/PrpD family protein [Pseudorhodoferax sp.]|uniref:MmgE/PrpD family protein n=1 Tax=Pseudorhodoferax sp. TaxID=1993553 RepID=UPI0039E47438
MTTLSRRIAAFTSRLTWEDIPAAVQDKCKASLLHNLGVAIAGGPLAVEPLRYAEALQEGGPGATARLLISGRPATPDTAALVNGALMHARAQDDVYFPGLTHAGSVMTPAALALAESRGMAGRDLLTAMVAGYEAAGALSQGFAMRNAPRGFRPTSVFGVFASTVAAARLLGLDEAATTDAIGIAANLAGGTGQAWVAGTQEWQLQIGFAARNGVTAARLAAAGVRGAPDALEGKAGFYQAFCGGAEGAAEAGRDLGQNWRSLQVTYKPFAVCAILQMPVTQAIALAREHDLRQEDIRAVRLRLPPVEAAYPGTDSRGPYAGVGATLMSAQFCLAMALTRRGARGADLQRLQDPELQPLIDRSSVVPDAGLRTRGFVLEVDCADGRTLRRESQAEGEPFDWSGEEVAANLRAMRDELPLSAEALERLVRTALHAQQHSAADIVSACMADA